MPVVIPLVVNDPGVGRSSLSVPEYIASLREGDPVWHPRLGEGVVVDSPIDAESDEFQVVFLGDARPRVRTIRAVIAGLEALIQDPERARAYEARQGDAKERTDRALGLLTDLLPGATVFRRHYWRHDLPEGFLAAAGVGPYLFLAEVFLENSAYVSGWGGSEASALQAVTTRVAVNSVVTALTELGHFVFDADLACPQRREYGSGDACGVVITFPDDSLVGVTIPVVVAVKTPFDRADEVTVQGEGDDWEDRSHAIEHFTGFPAAEFRFARVVVDDPDPRNAVQDALRRLPDPIALSQEGDEYDFDDLPF
jgi:hypothetical protein